LPGKLQRSSRPHPVGGALSDRVLYRDGLILVIDKPAGIAVHAGPGGGPDLERGFDALRFGLPRPPALAHRLDRDTSGCLVLGRHPKALRRLGALFSAGLVEKVYWAVVEGKPAEAEGRIETGLKKQTRRTGWRMVVDPAGQRAVTDYRRLGTDSGHSWLELRPRTGRTHQLRVHCAALGCPVVGDPVYGEQSEQTLQLYARSLKLPLYPNRPRLEITAPVPTHMLSTLERLGYDPAAEAASPSIIDGAAPTNRLSAASGPYLVGDLMRVIYLALFGTAFALVAGCVSPEEQRAMDQRQCTGYGFTPGTDAFANCMMNTSQQRDAQAAADRRAAADREAADRRAKAAAAPVEYNPNGGSSTSSSSPSSSSPFGPSPVDAVRDSITRDMQKIEGMP
jgi:tRNA pseudouridine32 synthase/23S rRNA pseudouridine746 synthase/23S rRNA pseudouridine1911/1915/1917 synthase